VGVGDDKVLDGGCHPVFGQAADTEFPENMAKGICHNDSVIEGFGPFFGSRDVIGESRRPRRRRDRGHVLRIAPVGRLIRLAGDAGYCGQSQQRQTCNHRNSHQQLDQSEPQTLSPAIQNQISAGGTCHRWCHPGSMPCIHICFFTTRHNLSHRNLAKKTPP
jgi:hypothetical protein